MRDKEWLKEEIKKLLTVRNQFYPHDEMVDLGLVLLAIDQLDEPEVLSQEWVDENVVEGDFRGGQQFWYGRFIEEEKVRNLLVPKQDKPVIPQFVADYIEKYKHDGLSLNGWFTFDYGNDGEKKVSEWLRDNDNETKRLRGFKLIDAIRYGYEVEKEKRYYIVEKINNSTLMTFELSDVVGEEVIEFVYGYSENETIHFNSKEKAELIAHFVGESLEVEEVKE